MRLSMQLPVVAGDVFVPDALMQCASAIERAGFDACFVTDHPFPTREWLATGGHETHDPFVALSFAAAATTTLRVHTHCLIPAYRNPYLTAKAVASLQALSRGRVILGVAAGYLRGEFDGLSVDYETRGAALDAAIGAMREAWQDRLATNVVHPLPSPMPPIWVGGNTSIAVERAAREGDGWAPFPASRRMAAAVSTAAISDVDALGRAIARFRELTASFGRPALDVCFSPFSHPAHLDRADPAALVDEALALRDVGVTWLAFHLPAPTPAAFCDAVAAFGADVVPKLQDVP